MIETLMYNANKKTILMIIKNIKVEIYLKLDAFENISVSIGCRLGLADTFFRR